MTLLFYGLRGSPRAGLCGDLRDGVYDLTNIISKHNIKIKFAQKLSGSENAVVRENVTILIALALNMYPMVPNPSS